MSGRVVNDARRILTSPCPRRGRREPKVSDGRGATPDIATMPAFFFARSQEVVLLSVPRPESLGIAVKRVGAAALSGVAPLPATPLFKRLSPTSPRTRRG